MPVFSMQRQITGNTGLSKGAIANSNWKNRQVITTGYTAAGYANSVTWRNVNKYSHSVNSGSDLGDLMQYAANYTSGASGRSVAFLWGTNGTGTDGNGAYVTTSCFNMRNDTYYTRTTSMDFSAAVGDAATMQASDQWGTPYMAWLHGSQSLSNGQCQKFNLFTEAFQTTITSGSFGQGGTGAGAHFDQNTGFAWMDDSAVASPPATGKILWTFATDQASTPSANAGWHGQQKGVSSKNGLGWTGNEGSYNGGNSFRRYNYSSGTVTSTTVAKPVTNSGEENLDMGQDVQYMMGMYNGSQNNLTWKFTYATEAGATSGYWQVTGYQARNPDGSYGTINGGTATSTIPGRSSGHSFWRD